ncbi:hypothetical protein B0A75_18485 [Flavobacterium oncorhynchi]|uniref:Uncharacterized protein n=2 Tax=Flavobacterium oncorhynchi TaxID=728056 RepID=A0A226HNK2_9FLAO|nr:hypothetical protein B0A75_18485 [Flavobacterium oncorhynchi]
MLKEINMFKNIFLFELKQQSKRRINYVFFILFVLQGVFYIKHTSDFFSADTSFHNAPAIVYAVLAGTGYLTFILVAFFASKALGKDLDDKTASLFYTTAVSESAFFWSRYLSSFFILLALSTGYLIGILIYPYTGISPQEKLMIFDLANFFKAIFYIFLPNIFVYFSVSFSLATIMKKNMGAYIGTLLFFVLLIFGDSSKDYGEVYTMVDASGFANLHLKLENLTALQKNSFALPLEGSFFINRLIWFSIATILLLVAYRGFSFLKFSEKKIKFKNDEPANTIIPTLDLPIIKIDLSLKSNISSMLRMALFEFKNSIRPIGFKIFMGFIFTLFIVYVTIYHQTYYSETQTLPITSEILKVTKPLAFFIYLFLIVSTTELLYKDRTADFWLISDVTPITNWSVILSKVLAMFLLSLLLSLSFIVMGIVVQTFKGFYDYQIDVYIGELIGRWLPKYFQYVLLTVFIASITAKKHITYIITCMLLMFTAVAQEMGMIEQFKYLFTFAPGGDFYTDMNGYGIFKQANSYFVIYWSSFALFLFFLSFIVWQRGIPLSLLQRVKNSKKRFSYTILLGLLLSGTIFIIYANKINQTTVIDNEFLSKEQQREENALYEKKYSKYSNSKQVKVTNIKATIDLFPNERYLLLNAEMTLKNKNNKKIDTLHIEWIDFYTIKKLAVKKHNLKKIQDDKKLKHAIYLITPAIEKNQQVELVVEANIQHKGFTNNDPQQHLTFNGSYFKNDIFPKFIGFDTDRIVPKNQYRSLLDLTKLQNRLSKFSDNVYASSLADSISYDFTISTAKEQRIIAPGVLKKVWVSSERNYYNYQSFSGTWYDFTILSAKFYSKKIEITKTSDRKPQKIEIYAHPNHLYNLDIIENAVKKALQNLHPLFGNYPYPTIIIAERPRYDNKLETVDNIIYLPENYAWIAKTSNNANDEFINYLFTKMIAKQYVQRLYLTQSQGFPVVVKSIPEYLALHFVQKDFGNTILEQHLKNLDDDYQKGISSASNQEIYWKQSDDYADYISESKGGLELYKLSKKQGAPVFLDKLRTFYSVNKDKKISAKDFTFLE